MGIDKWDNKGRGRLGKRNCVEGHEVGRTGQKVKGLEGRPLWESTGTSHVRQNGVGRGIWAGSRQGYVSQGLSFGL